MQRRSWSKSLVVLKILDHSLFLVLREDSLVIYSLRRFIEVWNPPDDWCSCCRSNRYCYWFYCSDETLSARERKRLLRRRLLQLIFLNDFAILDASEFESLHRGMKGSTTRGSLLWVHPTIDNWRLILLSGTSCNLYFFRWIRER